MKVKLYSRCLLLVMLGLSLSFSDAIAQSRSVSGKVIGTDDGLGVPGSSVVIKGTTTGVTTDMDGNYSIQTRGANDVLVFSFVGYSTQEITVGSQSVINVSLAPDAAALDEIIVTGYSVTNKKESTAAVSIVKAKDLRVVPSGNVEQQLAGRVAGVTVITNGQPGTNSTIRVRGFGAFGGNEPLIIVDGVPTGSSNFLSPDDIETTTVLKDAAAASIYGARAANGVIVYTTKRGAKGKRALEISYDGLYGVTDPNVNGAPEMLTPQEQADWTHIAYENNAAANGTAVQYTHPQYGSSAQATLPDYLHANGANGVRGSVDLAAIQAAYDADPENTFLIKPNLEGTNWYDAITRVAQIQRHSLGFNGGTENGRYYIGLNLQDQKGIIVNNSFQRYGMRVNSEFDLGKRFRFGENMQFTYTSIKGQAGGSNGQGSADDESQLLAAYRMPTVIPVYDEFGSFASTKAAGFNNPRNPLRSLTNDVENDQTFGFGAFGNVYLEFDPIKNLTLRSSLGGSISNNYYYGYGYRYLGDSEPQASNSFNEGAGFNMQWVLTNTANYKIDLGQSKINLLVGQEALNDGQGRYISGSGINPFTMDVDYVNLTLVQSPVVNSGLYSGVNFSSYFGKVDYNLMDKYFVTGVLRRDGASRFGANNRYGVFPAFSAGWRVSDEEFMKDLSFITDLKVRAGWGLMGNSNNVSPNNQYSLYAQGTGTSLYPIGGQSSGADPGYYKSRIGNPDAKWETSETANIGFDATFANGKFEAVLDIWQKTTRDLLYTVPLPAVVGPNSSAPSVNVGEMVNKGIDIQLINRGNLTSAIKYNLTVNGSFLKNEIVELAPGVPYFDGAAYRGIQATRNQPGQSISSFFGYKMIGYFNTQGEVDAHPAQEGAAVGRFKYEDVNGDGVITPDDRTFIGSPVPDFTGGINFGIEFGNWDVNTYFNTFIGNEIWNQSKWFTDFHGTFEGSGKGVRAKESWTPELGDNALAPIWESATNLSTSGVGNSWYVEDGSYFRMQNLSVGYSLDQRIAEKLGLSRGRISISGNNLFTLSGYSGLDPGVGGDADSNFGIDVGNFPVTRSFNVALNLGF
ncbi:SusC/RagA family TonB-linked outer membrane protein [Arcticibacterium luteifluviistationis]|uniref:SusC/RagA family protein n=1 Tax=Arcticibacterium luteifluviistationis TaxID=1784714 RepID=A0A2Z4GAT3_9BACT|nr:TonB-dependent receptor [Arcticibacterium luteifluviistationis]AWV98140.1 SusC/RagA family protein [Arcticibacterium luteifluviistationis]